MQQTILFNKDRSIKACMADAWKIIALNWRSYLRLTYPYLLLAGIANALFFEITLQYICQQAEPAYLLMQSGGATDVIKWMATPNVSNGIYMLFTLLLSIFGNTCLIVKFFNLIRHYSNNNEMPKAMHLWLSKSDYGDILRIIGCVVCYGLPTIIIGSLIVWTGLKWHLLLLIILPFLLLYASAACYLFTLKHILLGVATKQSVVYSLKHAFGLAFILLILTSIPVMFVYIVVLMPQTVYGLSSMAYTRSLIMSDAAYMPTWMSIFTFLLNICGYAITALAGSYQLWCMSLKVNTRHSIQ